MARPEESILIANRGEIAIRIARSANELGLRTVGIYSEEDSHAMHRYKVDEAWLVGAPESKEKKKLSPVASYLAIEEIVALAKKRNVSLVHPGYGFLAENAVFAQKIHDAGILFVGPSPEVIRKMGDKTTARQLALDVDVPVVPGSPPVRSLAEVESFINQYGLPIIIKAAMGGGGRGMRVVKSREEVEDAFQRAISEATQAFGDGTVFIERFLEKPRHIEVQLLGDSYGNVMHLFERDCSVQRRHQKVVEMAPALSLHESVRDAIIQDALKLARHCKYTNAGTAEFLVDQQNRHYFIEINPRIQVEHTVTEEVTGLDIVASQIRIAMGASLKDLNITPENVKLRGHAIQCRITTEDPLANFTPDTGKISVYRSAGGNGIRLDGGPGYAGAIITPHYDSLLVKITATAPTFELSRRKILRALSEFRIRGVKTNIPFLHNLLNHPNFIAGETWTTFIDDTPELFHLNPSKNRGQKLLSYLADIVVNGSSIAGQKGEPGLRDYDPLLPDTLPPSLPPKALILPLQPHEGGLRQIFLQDGPEAFAKAIRSKNGTFLMDTTWRDAHQSLLATRLRTIDIARIAPLTSHCLKNAYALEMWGGATFDVALRFLHECPWERLKQLRQLCPNIPFSMLLRGANAVGYTSYPDNVVYEFCKKAKNAGVDVFRIFDSLNYLENLKLGIDAVKKAGGIIEATVCYTGDVSDPSRTRYNLKYYLDLVKQLVDYGIHVLAIKDMAGLLKPRAATMLISAIRKEFPDVPIHVHTHDTSGNGVAAMIATAEAGADVIDLAIDSLSGVTSQPCMGSVVAALAGTKYDLGVDFEHVQLLNGYWEQVRLLYQCFDPQVNSPSSEVYEHEMPGGQYTNLLFQATSLGLGTQWTAIKKAYVVANRLCGDIIKVTPSSKVVGDFAQFLVSNNLTEQDVLLKADTLSFPKSVVEYFQGYLGQPPYGFPEPLRTKIIRNEKRIEGRPGKDMPSLDLTALKESLASKYGPVTEEDAISAALYPKVFEDFKKNTEKFGDLSVLPTRYFLSPLNYNEEMSVTIEPGKTLYIKLVAVGHSDVKTGTRDVFFQMNGESRVVSVADKSANVKQETRRKADSSVPGNVGAPMAGVVVELRVQKGATVAVGDPLAILSAMKMETVVSSPVSGVIDDVAVKQGDSLSTGDLICNIKK